MLVKYVGPIREVYVPDAGMYVTRDEVIDVPDSIAGSAPAGDDLGHGLLAQVDNFVVDGE